MDEKEVLKLIAFMVTSARGLFNEPMLYGPYRMTDAIVKMVDMLKKNHLIESEKINQIVDKIYSAEHAAKKDEVKFKNLLDEMIDDLVDFIT